jgi:hypothetical protein
MKWAGKSFLVLLVIFTLMRAWQMWHQVGQPVPW